MTRLVSCLCFIAAYSSCLCCFASEWKLVSTAKDETGIQYKFYDAESVKRKPDGHVRVWIKAVYENEIRFVVLRDVERARLVEQSSKKKYESGYRPIYDAKRNLDESALTGIIMFEESMNLFPDIRFSSKLLMDLDCNEERYRLLSATTYKNGKESTATGVSEWRYIPPDSAGADLSKIFCSGRQ